ncbi:MAG TPA: hypothetical protein VGF94_11585 [Kofleriaceae bacterium]
MQFIVYAAFGATAAGGAVYEMVRRQRARRRVAAGGSRLDDNALVTLRGTVHPGAGILIAPLSGQPCVAYRACVRVYDPSTRPRITVHERSELAGFTLWSHAGPLPVEGDRLELSFKAREFRMRDNDRARALVAALGLPYQPDVTTCDEVIVAPGQTVTVHGVVRVVTVPAEHVDIDFRDAARATRIVGDEHHPLVIADI